MNVAHAIGGTLVAAAQGSGALFLALAFDALAIVAIIAMKRSRQPETRVDVLPGIEPRQTHRSN